MTNEIHVNLSRRAALALALTLLPVAVRGAGRITFDDLPLAGPDSFWNGSDQSGGFESRGVHFRNDFEVTYNSWSGFAYSNVNDPDTPGWFNQYAVISGTGRGNRGNYAVVFDGADVITLDAPAPVRGFYLNNTTYTALSLREGDAFAKKFGGTSGDDPDWFKVTINGWDQHDASLGSVEFYLADYRFEESNQDYIVDEWTYVDLSGLGSPVKSLTFDLDSTDVGAFGLNTPTYFAMDDLIVVPEPRTWVLGVLGALILFRRGRLRLP